MKLYFNNAFSIIKEDQHYFLFEKKDQKKTTINEDMFHLLNEIQKLNGIDSDKYVEISSLIMELKEKNILTSISQLSCDNFFIKNYSVEMLFIELSKKCNLKCQHCYNESLYSIKDTLTTAELFKLIDQAKSLGIFKVQLTGGEPLLRKDIVDILEYLFKSGFSIKIFTNLTLLKNKHLALIKKFHISIVTSLDFLTDKQHDTFRGKVGTFNTTLNSIKLLKEERVPVRVNSILDGKSNIEIEDFVNFLKQELTVDYLMDIIIPTGRADCVDIKEFYRLVEAYKVIAVDQQTSSTQFTFENECNISKNCIYANDCGIQKSFLFIDHLGNVGICPSLRIDHSSMFCLGNILHTPLEKMCALMETKKNDIECRHKKSCAFFKNCHGGCRSRAYHFSNGDINSVDPVMCNLFDILEEHIDEVHKFRIP